MNLSKLNSNASINQILDGFFNSTIGDFIGSDVIATHPRVNIIEKENLFEISLAAPGLNKSDFHVSLENNILKIEVKKEKEDELINKEYRRREFSFNRFERSFTLPEDLDTEHINATYENGILKLAIAKLEEKKTSNKNIEIS